MLIVHQAAILIRTLNAFEYFATSIVFDWYQILIKTVLVRIPCLA